MHPERRAVEILGLGLLFVLGFYLQVRQIRRDWDKAKWLPRRLYIPLAVSAMVFLGFLFHGLLSMFDGRQDFEFARLGRAIGIALFFAVLLNGKMLFAYAFLAYCLGDTLYSLCEFNEWKIWVLLDFLLDCVFDGTPRWLKCTYQVATCAYALLSATIEEWLA